MYIMHKRNTTKAWNHGLVLKKVYKVITFIKAWLRPYIDMNRKLRKKCKKQFLKTFSHASEWRSFWKNHGKFFPWTIFIKKHISNRNEEKTLILMNKPVYLCLSILKTSKLVMYEFWYDYVKPVYIKTEEIYIDTAKNDETRYFKYFKRDHCRKKRIKEELD